MPYNELDRHVFIGGQVRVDETPRISTCKDGLVTITYQKVSPTDTQIECGLGEPVARISTQYVCALYRVCRMYSHRFSG